MEAIVRGGLSHDSRHPLWIIHTSGTVVLAFQDEREGTIGVERPKIWDDWEGVDEVTAIPDEASHRAVDKVILTAGREQGDSMRTAIVCPPVIYGPTRGSCHNRSMQAYWMSKLVMQRGRGFCVGQGENWVTAVHVQDLTDLYMSLGNCAEAGGGPASWGANGYYFAQSQEFKWKEMHKLVAELVFEKGLISSPRLEYLTKEQILEICQSGVYAWGLNQRCRAIRACQELGWSPFRPSLRECFPGIIDSEARRLGKSA